MRKRVLMVGTGGTIAAEMTEASTPKSPPVSSTFSQGMTTERSGEPGPGKGTTAAGGCCWWRTTN